MLSQSATLYYQGFETDTSGWYIDSGGAGDGSITRTASGGGNLHLTAAEGAYYAEVHINTDAYSPGYGTGGYTLFGNTTSGPQPYPGSSFTQSMDIYIDPSTAAPSNPGVAAFWLDASPSSTDPLDAVNGGMGYGAEHDFAFLYNGSSVTVEADDGNGPTLATISVPGWYDFQFLYSQSDSTATDLSNTTLGVYTLGGVLLGSTTLVNDDATGNPLQNQYLGGPGYDWLTVWQDGFSNGMLGIDDIRADSTATPEPATLAVSGAGLLLVCGAGFRKRNAQRRAGKRA